MHDEDHAHDGERGSIQSPPAAVLQYRVQTPGCWRVRPSWRLYCNRCAQAWLQRQHRAPVVARTQPGQLPATGWPAYGAGCVPGCVAIRPAGRQLARYCEPRRHRPGGLLVRRAERRPVGWWSWAAQNEGTRLWPCQSIQAGATHPHGGTCGGRCTACQRASFPVDIVQVEVDRFAATQSQVNKAAGDGKGAQA